MKPNIQIKVSYCPDCKGDISASLIFTKEINSLKKLERIVGSDSEFSCMDFKNLNEFNDEVQIKNLSEKTVSFQEYEREHSTFICGCTDLCRKVKSFEDACKILGISDHVPYFGNIPEKLKTQLVAHYKLSIITHVLNNGSQINWNMEDSQLNTDSYYPRDFYKPKDDSDTGFCTYGHCENPERSPGLLCYLTEDSISEYAGVQFRDLYIELYQNPNNYIID